MSRSRAPGAERQQGGDLLAAAAALAHAHAGARQALHLVRVGWRRRPASGCSARVFRRPPASPDSAVAEAPGSRAP